MEYKKHIMDNVHGKIALTELEYQIINTSIFKRLKGIKQLGTVHEVFPTGEHTRFPHSLGTMHTETNNNFVENLKRHTISICFIVILSPSDPEENSHTISKS